MAEVTREMILEYMQRKGGVVKNVDLVRHFRKFLQVDNSAAKGIAGGSFVYSVLSRPYGPACSLVSRCLESVTFFTATHIGGMSGVLRKGEGGFV